MIKAVKKTSRDLLVKENSEKNFFDATKISKREKFDEKQQIVFRFLRLAFL